MSGQPTGLGVIVEAISLHVNISMTGSAIRSILALYLKTVRGDFPTSPTLFRVLICGVEYPDVKIEVYVCVLA